MSSFLSICLALLRLAIRTTNIVQGLLIDLHNTVEWVIEQQGDPLEIRSTDEQSTSTASRLHPSADTVDVVPSERVSKPISTAEDNPSISILGAFQSQILEPTPEAPVISTTSKIFKGTRVQPIVCKSENGSGETSQPSVAEDEAKIKETESNLKLCGQVQTTESVLSERAYSILDSEHHSAATTFDEILQNNKPPVVSQSVFNSGADEEDSLILKGNESKWKEFRMMLQWYRKKPVLPGDDALEQDELTELEPLDLSTNSDNVDDTIYPEETNEPHSNLLPNLLETTKESQDTSMQILSESTPCKLTPIDLCIVLNSSETTTSSASIDPEVQESIHKPSTSQKSESAKSKDDSRHKKGKSEEEANSLHSSESTSSSKIHVPLNEVKTDVALEVKSHPEIFMTSETGPHRATYDLDLKFERNLHLKEYDISSIREKGTSKIKKSPIRDIDSNKKTQSQVNQSPSDRKSGRTPVKSNKSSGSPSLAVGISPSLSLPRFCIDSSTGNVQWKSDMTPKDVYSESKQQSLHRPSSKSPKQANIETGRITGARFPTKMESGKNRLVTEPKSKRLPSETSTSEDEFQFKPTRERRPTPPPARFPKVETSTDSEKVESKAKSLCFITEPIKMSTVKSEFRPTRERRLTPAARLPIIEFTRISKDSADKDERTDDREKYEPSISSHNKCSVGDEMEFKSTRERRPTPAAKIIDHESTSSDNESDKKPKLAISVPRATRQFKENSPLKFQQKPILTTDVAFGKSSLRNVVYNRQDKFSPSLNQSTGVAESGEFAFKPTRDRRPTPAARFPTPESTDSETACEKPKLSRHLPQSLKKEASSMKEAERNSTCERKSPSVPAITISGSPTSKDDSPVSKLSSRLVRKSSLSPRSSGKSRFEGRTSPTVRFHIPESQTKRENTGAIWKESKFVLRKTASEMSTSEEEYDSKLPHKRKASPAKYPFYKSPKMLEGAAAAARSLRFSPKKTSSEKNVETQSLCEGNTVADRVRIFEKAAENENAHSASASSGTLPTELLGRINKSVEGVLTPGSAIFPYDEDLYSSTYEGDSAPEAVSLERPSPHPATRAPHNSPINFKTTDDTSTEMSQSESTTGTTTSDEQEDDSALEAETDICPQPKCSESSSTGDSDERFLRMHGIRLVRNSASESTTETSMGYESGGESALEGAGGILPQSIPESSAIVDVSGEVSISESARESRRDFVPEVKDHPENCTSLRNADTIEGRVETDSTSLNLTETSGSNGSGEDSSPEGTSDFFPQTKTVESRVNAEGNKDVFCEDETSASGDVCNPAPEEQEEENKASIRTRVENDTKIEADSTSSKPLKRYGSEDDSDPEGTEHYFLQTSTKEILTNVENSKDTISKVDAISAEKKSCEILTRTGGNDSAPAETSDSCQLPEISTFSTRGEKTIVELNAKMGSPPPESASNIFIKRSSRDSEPIEALDQYSNTETKILKTSGDSDNTSVETDSTSSESTSNGKSSGDGTGDDSATEGAHPVISTEMDTSEFPKNSGMESKDEPNARTDSVSSRLSSNTSTNKRFNRDSAFEEETDNCPQVEAENSPTNSSNARAAGIDFSSGFAQSKISEIEDFERDSAPGELTVNDPLNEAGDSARANDTDEPLEYNQAYLIEVHSTDAESSAPEGLSPIYEVSRNGTITDFSNYSVSENEHSTSSPSESSSEVEGEFILEQGDPNAQNLFHISPTNGDSSSDPDAMIRWRLSGRSEHLHAIESPAEISTISESDTMSSLSSKLSNSEEEGEHVLKQVEATSEPNSDEPETCNVPILSLNSESKNMEDCEIKDQNVCKHENENLEVSDYGGDIESVLIETVRRITEGNIHLQETVPQSHSQILDIEFNSNSVPRVQYHISRNVPVEENTGTAVLETLKNKYFISEEVENSIVSEKNPITELQDTSVPEKEICNSALDPEYLSTKQKPAAEMEYNTNTDLSQSEVSSIKESVAIEKEIETSRVFVQDASCECEAVCENTITELADSQLLASVDSEVNGGELAIPIESNAFESIICKDVPLKCLSEMGDGLYLEIPTSTLNIELSPSVGQVDSENGSIFSESLAGDILIDMDSAKCDYGEVSTQSFNTDTTSDEESAITKSDSSTHVASETIVNEPHKNVSYTNDDSALDKPMSPCTTMHISGIAQNETKNDITISNLINKLEESSETFIHDSSKSVASLSMGYAGNVETPVSSEELICNIPTSEDTELDSGILIGSDSLIVQCVPNLKSELNIEHFDSQSESTTNVSTDETLADDLTEMSESITCNELNVILGTTENSDSRNNLTSESLICDNSTISESEKENKVDPEERKDSESLDLEVSPGDDFSELKESNISQRVISGTRCTNSTKINDADDSLTNIDSMSDPSNDCIENVKLSDVTELQLYIVSEPVPADIAFGSTIEVLHSSEAPTDSSPDTDYVEKISDLKTSATEFDFCGIPVTEHGGDRQDESNLRSEICDESTTAGIVKEISISKSPVDSIKSNMATNDDIKDESSISKSPVTAGPMVRDEPTTAVELAHNANLGPLLSNVLETHVCEVPKDGHIKSGKPVVSEHESGDGQELETNFTVVICDTTITGGIVKDIYLSESPSASMVCDEPTSDIEEKSSVSQYPITIAPMVSDEISAEELVFNANLDPSVPSVLDCELSMHGKTESDNELACSLEVDSSLDFAQSEDKLSEACKEVEESANVENKAWKKKPRKAKKKRKH